MIWDLHCHLNGLPGRTPDERMAQIIEYADRMGIDRLCMYMGRTLITHPTAAELRSQNDEVLEALTHWHHRAFGFVYLSPRLMKESFEELDRCVKDGPMVGVKLWVDGSCGPKEIDPLIIACHKLKAVIFQHTWFKATKQEADESTPFDVAALAARHPNIPLICGHTGGDWEKGIRAIRAHKYVSVDLAGSDPCSGFVEMAVRELGAERVIYGSDIGGRSFASQLAKVQGANITEAERKLILGENLKRMMLPILEKKGVKP